MPDDEGGGYARARHLADRGHRRIGMIELPDGMVARPLGRKGVDQALAEADLRPARHGLAMVFQSYALYPHMTVAENKGHARSG